MSFFPHFILFVRTFLTLNLYYEIGSPQQGFLYLWSIRCFFFFFNFNTAHFKHKLKFSSHNFWNAQFCCIWVTISFTISRVYWTQDFLFFMLHHLKSKFWRHSWVYSESSWLIVTSYFSLGSSVIRCIVHTLVHTLRCSPNKHGLVWLKLGSLKLLEP